MATFYSPKEYKDWQSGALTALKAVGAGHVPLTPFEGPLTVGVTVQAERPKTTKLPHPKPDVDNYAKAVLDAITADGRFWHDDTQVQTLIVSKGWADTPLISVVITPL